MKLLLDTHVFLWFISADPRLKSTILAAIRDPANEVHLSVVSVWESTIKYGLGKLALPASPAEYFPIKRLQHRIATLPLEERDIAQLAKLPALHRDPFDRMIIAQSLQHDLTLVSDDKAVMAYPVKVFGA